jgi:hypothetical protein
MMRRLFVTLLFLLAATSAHAAKLSDYKGADAGWLVFSLAMPTYAPTTGVGFQFRRLPDGASEDVRFAPLMAMGILGTVGGKDFNEPAHGVDRPLPATVAAIGGQYGKSTYVGQVWVMRLAPGLYEITRFRAQAEQPGLNLRKDLPTRVPFKIEPGTAIYLGELREAPLEVKRGVFHNPLGWATIASDQSGRDFPIARKKVVGLPLPAVAVPSAEVIGTEAGAPPQAVQ